VCRRVDLARVVYQGHHQRFVQVDVKLPFARNDEKGDGQMPAAFGGVLATREVTHVRFSTHELEALDIGQERNDVGHSLSR
jgi:hypothetical protein